MISRTHKHRKRRKKRLAKQRRALREEIFRRAVYIAENYGNPDGISSSNMWHGDDVWVAANSQSVFVAIGPPSAASVYRWKDESVVYHNMLHGRVTANYEKIEEVLPILRKVMVLDDLADA